MSGLRPLRGPFLASALLALGMALGSCGDAEEEAAPQPTATNGTPDATQSPSPAASLIASPSPSVAPGPTFTYTDPTYGYSIDYPATWYLSPPKENGGSNVILYSYDRLSVPPEDRGKPIPADKLKVVFWVADGVTKPLSDWLAEGDSSPGQISPPVVVSQAEVVFDGKRGTTRVTDEGEGIEHVNYYIPIGSGRVFVVNAGRADSQLWPRFELVLASIRFAP